MVSVKGRNYTRTDRLTDFSIFFKCLRLNSWVTPFIESHSFCYRYCLHLSSFYFQKKKNFILKFPLIILGQNKPNDLLSIGPKRISLSIELSSLLLTLLNKHPTVSHCKPSGSYHRCLAHSSFVSGLGGM